jgi:hypothetical protein
MSRRCIRLYDLMCRPEGVTVAEARKLAAIPSDAAVRDAVRTIKECFPVTTTYARSGARVIATYCSPPQSWTPSVPTP